MFSSNYSFDVPQDVAVAHLALYPSSSSIESTQIRCKIVQEVESTGTGKPERCLYYLMTSNLRANLVTRM